MSLEWYEYYALVNSIKNLKDEIVLLKEDLLVLKKRIEELEGRSVDRGS